jgi:hypothetical protein
LLFLGVLFCGVDYAKHYILLTKVRAFCEKNAIIVQDAGIEYGRRGASLHLDTVAKDKVEAEHVRLRIPYRSFSSCTLTVNQMSLDSIKIHWGYGVVSMQGETIDVSYYSLKDIDFSIFEEDFFVDEIAGKLSYHPEKLTYTIYSDMIKMDDSDLFKVASYGTIDHVMESEQRRGTMEVRVTSVKHVFELLERSHVLPAWQAALFKNFVKDNSYIPFSLKKRTLFLGPLKIATLDF